MTTEQIIKAKTIGGKLSKTLEINANKQLLNEINGMKQKFSLEDDSIMDIQQTIMPYKNISINSKGSIILQKNNKNNNNNNNNNSQINTKKNVIEVKKKDYEFIIKFTDENYNAQIEKIQVQYKELK